MQIIEVDPKNCIRWEFADRSGFEFGDIFELAQDIAQNGQVEPVILRKSKTQTHNMRSLPGVEDGKHV